MPEGAEVKIIGEGLAKKIGIRRLVNVEAITGRYTKKSISGLDLLRQKIKTNGSIKVTGVGVKGKLIFWMLSDEIFLLNTLGMTGTWTKMLNHKHARVRFEFDVGDPVFFVDSRNFGTIKFIFDKREFVKKLDSLGPDMLSESVTIEQFTAALDKKPHWTLAKVLMNQSILCGIGNYVKAESLYRAKLSPWRIVGSLSSREMKALNQCIQLVLQQAYADHGASITSYKDTDGKNGSAVSRFMVYDKKFDPHGNKVIKEETHDGRITHWVPTVQK